MDKNHCPTCGAFPVDVEKQPRIQAAMEKIIASVLYNHRPNCNYKPDCTCGVCEAVRELKAARGGV